MRSKKPAKTTKQHNSSSGSKVSSACACVERLCALCIFQQGNNLEATVTLLWHNSSSHTSILKVTILTSEFPAASAQGSAHVGN